MRQLVWPQAWHDRVLRSKRGPGTRESPRYLQASNPGSYARGSVTRSVRRCPKRTTTAALLRAGRAIVSAPRFPVSGPFSGRTPAAVSRFRQCPNRSLHLTSAMSPAASYRTNVGCNHRSLIGGRWWRFHAAGARSKQRRGMGGVDYRGIHYTIVCEHRTPKSCQVYLAGADGSRQILSANDPRPDTCSELFDQLETIVSPLMVRMALRPSPHHVCGY